MKLPIFAGPLIAWGGLLLGTAHAWTQTLLVPAGSTWKYNDSGSNLGVVWRLPGGYSDDAWPAGPAQLGYGDGDEATTIGFGPNSGSKYVTSYFRHEFNVEDPPRFTNLVMGLVRDDGAVVYLNGTEVFRSNMPEGVIGYTTPAAGTVSGADEAAFFRTNVSPTMLRVGTNLLAVEVHQINGTSSDVSFDLFLVGQEDHPSGQPLAFFVATNGNDAWSGTVAEAGESDGPFATLQRARDAIRSYSLLGLLPAGGASVEISGGAYELAQPLELTSQDTGTASSPIVYRAETNASVHILGGRQLSGWTLVTDPAVLGRLDESARGQVWQTDLRAQGITNFGVIQGGNTWAQSDPGLELFYQDQPTILARWPNDGYVEMVEVLGPTPIDVRGTVGTREGIFRYAGDRPSRWAGEPDIMVHGFWFWDWADQRHRVQSIDTTNRIIELAEPYHTYGYRQGQWFYAYNILAELDQPREWYLDRPAGILYFWPDTPPENGTAMVSLLPSLVTLTDVAHTSFAGMIFEGCQETALSIAGGQSNLICACTVRNVGKNAIRISDSPGSGVRGCEIYFAGDGGINLSGGDRPTLTPAGLFAEHNRIHHWSRWNPVYKAGISLNGVGNRAAHNLMHDAPHMAIGFGGNDHAIEYNEIYHVVNESNDAGVIYAGRKWTARGHLIRYNYIHHIYGFERRGCIGVYLDDQFSSAEIYGNIFYKVPTAILIGGGRQNIIDNNVFVDCNTAVSIDARGLGWGVVNGGTLTNDLLSMPYQSPPWSERYPELVPILEEDPMAPQGNVLARNICWDSGWTRIQATAEPGVSVSNNLVDIDPMFADLEHLNFALQPESPAFALGFQSIPLEEIGPDTNLWHAPWLPTVTLVEPPAQAVFGSPANLALEAVVSDPEQRVTQVGFYVGLALLDDSAPFPYRSLWSNAPPGLHDLSARLVPDGELGHSLRPVPVRVDHALIATGSVWKYWDAGTSLNVAWRFMESYDSSWPSGPAELGYGDESEGRPEATRISYGPNSSDKHITYYFRHTFAVENTNEYANLALGLLRDDGAVVYLNGSEVFRSNLTNGPITESTRALSAVGGSDESTYYGTQLSPALLRAGNNLVAVEVHQQSPTSSDVSFDLFLHAMPREMVPELDILWQDNAIALAWPVAAATYRLQATGDLTAPNWQPVASPALIAGNQIHLTMDTVPGQQFFRLNQP